MHSNSEYRRESLSDLPNISIVLAEHLAKVGVVSPAHLRCLGAEESWARMREAGLQDGLQTLLALEGAIVGVSWRSLPGERRRELFHFANHGFPTTLSQAG